MNSEGAAAGLQPVFPLLGHPPSVGPWGWGALSALRCPLPQAPAPAVPFKGALTCCVQPSHFLFPSVVQAGTAGWAPFAPVSAPPLLTLTLPNRGAGGREAEKPAPHPAPPGRGTQSQSLAFHLAPEHSNLPALPPGF